ncbi:WSCD family member CG9164-like [Dysidea avara]|uniref:WSCD family member CG9164-like n=1 Tax=Dysidea avara TaxID=196820 RepID=UPI0033185D44
MIERLRSSPNISLQSSLNGSQGSTNNQSLQSSLNDSLESSLKVDSLQSSFNETRHVLEMLQKKGIMTIGGGHYVGRYKAFRNFTDSQIDNIITAFGIPNLNSSNFKEQILACTGLTLVNAKKPVNITTDGNVVMPKHFQKCKSMSFQKTGKTVALFCFPGSGNSWVRQLIETTTGIYTGTYQDCDDSYIFNGMIGEGVYTDNVIAVKIHFPNTDDQKWLDERSIIYVVRNPFDAILVEWNQQKSASKNHNMAHLSTTTVFGKAWIATVTKYSKLWRLHIEAYAHSNKTPILVLKYENLLTDLHTELKRMMEFMKFPYTEDDFQCTINSTIEGFHRKHKKTADPYTPELRKVVMEQVNLANKVLHHYNISY